MIDTQDSNDCYCVHPWGGRTLTRNLVWRSKGGNFLIREGQKPQMIPEKTHHNPNQGGRNRGQRSAALCKFKSAVHFLLQSPDWSPCIWWHSGAAHLSSSSICRRIIAGLHGGRITKHARLFRLRIRGPTKLVIAWLKNHLECVRVYQGIISSLDRIYQQEIIIPYY